MKKQAPNTKRLLVQIMKKNCPVYKKPRKNTKRLMGVVIISWIAGLLFLLSSLLFGPNLR
jgi:hypothetical protein